MADEMKITILDDGSIKIETDKISAGNHVNAETVIREMFQLAGGDAKRFKKAPRSHHQQQQTQRQ